MLIIIIIVIIIIIYICIRRHTILEIMTNAGVIEMKCKNNQDLDVIKNGLMTSVEIKYKNKFKASPPIQIYQMLKKEMMKSKNKKMKILLMKIQIL